MTTGAAADDVRRGPSARTIDRRTDGGARGTAKRSRPPAAAPPHRRHRSGDGGSAGSDAGSGPGPGVLHPRRHPGKGLRDLPPQRAHRVAADERGLPRLPPGVPGDASGAAVLDVPLARPGHERFAHGRRLRLRVPPARRLVEHARTPIRTGPRPAPRATPSPPRPPTARAAPITSSPPRCSPWWLRPPACPARR